VIACVLFGLSARHYTADSRRFAQSREGSIEVLEEQMTGIELDGGEGAVQ
jgi:hypothetical protein